MAATIWTMFSQHHHILRHQLIHIEMMYQAKITKHWERMTIFHNGDEVEHGREHDENDGASGQKHTATVIGEVTTPSPFPVDWVDPPSHAPPPAYPTTQSAGDSHEARGSQEHIETPRLRKWSFDMNKKGLVAIDGKPILSDHPPEK